MAKNKRVFIVHCWGGGPGDHWYPWLKKELEARGFSVTVPQMPNTDKPEINSWISHLRGVVGEPDENTYLVGHSVGCQTILRYIEQAAPVGGAVCVGGWFELAGVEDGEETAIVKPWLETPLSSEAVRAKVGRLVAIFSKNDPHVSLGLNRKVFKKEFGAEIIVERKKGHFLADDGVKELPAVLDAVLKMAEK